MGIDKNKYTVIKTEEWKEIERLGYNDRKVHPIHDAVVIRKQDVFAATALHQYADIIRSTVEIIRSLGLMYEGEEKDSIVGELMELADWFHEQAVEAEEYVGRKVPD